MTGIVEIHVTCPSLEEARELTHILLDARLVACCNIGKEVDSRFLYAGSKERQDEVPLTLKTRADLFDACAAKIRENHSYETPAIFGFAVDHADEATREWVTEVTSA